MHNRLRSTPSTSRGGSSGFAGRELMDYATTLLENMETILNDLTTTSLSSGTQLAFMDGHDTVHTDKNVVVPVTSLERLGDSVTLMSEILQRLRLNMSLGTLRRN